MAVEQLSAKLKTFKENVNLEAIASMKNAASEIGTSVNSAINSFDSALNGIQSGIKEDMGDSLKNCMQLILEASNRLKASMDTNDMMSILTQCESLYKYIVEEIEEKIKYVSGLEPGFFKDEWVILDGVRQLINQWFDKDQYQIDRGNAEIENMNKNGEAQLAAIAEIANAVDLGIIGKMSATNSDGLGGWVSFSENYHFNRQEWEAANPVEYPLTIVDTVGCFIVGQVEGVASLVEGLVDFVITPVAWVTSALGWDGVENFIATDWSKKGADAVISLTGLQNDANARAAGKFVGQVVGAVGVSVIPGVGPVAAMALMGMSTGGMTIQSSLQSGDSLGVASLKGAGMAVLTFGIGKIAGPLTEKLTKVPVVGKVVTAAGKGLGNFAKIATGQAGEVAATTWYGKAAVRAVNILTKPAQVAANVLITRNPAVSVLATGLTSAGNALNNSAVGQRLADTKIGEALGFTKTPAIDTPDPIPDPTPDPIPDSTPDPIPDSTPDPIPDPIPDSTPDPAAPTYDTPETQVDVPEDWIEQHNAFGSDIPESVPVDTPEVPSVDTPETQFDVPEDWMEQHNAFGSDIPGRISIDPPEAQFDIPEVPPVDTPEVQVASSNVNTPEQTYQEALQDWIDAGRPKNGDVVDYLNMAYNDIPQDNHVWSEIVNPNANYVGTEVGYVQNGEFIPGSSAPSGQQITAENSMFN